MVHVHSLLRLKYKVKSAVESFVNSFVKIKSAVKKLTAEKICAEKVDCVKIGS